jgi:hypothetical protein
MMHILPITGALAIFTIVAEPVTPWITVLGLLRLTLAIVVLSCFLIHWLETTLLGGVGLTRVQVPKS